MEGRQRGGGHREGVDAERGMRWKTERGMRWKTEGVGHRERVDTERRGGHREGNEMEDREGVDTERGRAHI